MKKQQFYRFDIRLRELAKMIVCGLGYFSFQQKKIPSKSAEQKVTALYINNKSYLVNSFPTDVPYLSAPSNKFALIAVVLYWIQIATSPFRKIAMITFLISTCFTPMMPIRILRTIRSLTVNDNMKKYLEYFKNKNVNIIDYRNVFGHCLSFTSKCFCIFRIFLSAFWYSWSSKFFFGII